MNDLKFAFRQLPKNSCFTAVEILTVVTTVHSQPAPVSVTQTNKIDVGSYGLQFIAFGQGKPTVVIDSGLGEPAVESGTWKTVIDDISRTTRICVYDRAGLGASDAPPKLPRTSREVAKDLHTLLHKANGQSRALYPGRRAATGHRCDPRRGRCGADFRKFGTSAKAMTRLGTKREELHPAGRDAIASSFLKRQHFRKVGSVLRVRSL